MSDETTKAMACSNCGGYRAYYADGSRECSDCGLVLDWTMVGSGTLTLQTMATGIGRAPTADACMDGNAGGDVLQRTEAEIDRLKAENTALHRRINDMERTLMPVQFNPATGRDEILDPVAMLDEAIAQVPREDRFCMFTLPGAVAEMAKCIEGLRALVAEKDRMLHEARAEVAPLDVENLHIGPESVIILRAYRISPAEARERAKEVRDAIRQQTGHAVLVIVAGCDDSITLGRRPIGMPEYVREAYAEAAAASYGVTPDVVQRKKAERRALKAAGPCPIPVGEWFRNRDTGELGRVMDAHLQAGKYPRWHLRIEVHNEQGEPQGIGINDAVDSLIFQWKPDAGPTRTRPPFGSKAIGTDLVPYPEPAL